MRKIVVCLATFGLVVLWSPRVLSADVLQTITIQPAVAFSLEPNGTVDPGGFIFGAFFEEEMFREYDISGLATPITATLNLTVLNFVIGAEDTGNTLQFQVSTYAGNGQIDTSDYGAGTLLRTFSTPVALASFSFSAEVAPVIQSLQASGATHLGIRFHDPLLVEINKIDQLSLPFGFDKSLVVTVVPEPSAVLLLAVGLGLVLRRPRSA